MRQIVISIATGAILRGPATGLEAGEGEELREWLLSADAGTSVWNAASRAFVDVPPVSRLDALIALLVAKGTITHAEANALPQ
jgi:hypothetical protein